ncbi:unnamed protein product [Toxocara canis]|uniref:GLOBIN domain-containing protein n=1 Tax=Toxocara canis TaxID=6265 RepID=A0A183UGD8_TOXCA|nr:unnamed protein product [Toxocara canis]
MSESKIRKDVCSAQQCPSDSPPFSTDHSDILTWDPNAAEKELLKRTWSDDFEFLYQLGTNIYSYIFETHPKAKELFPFLLIHGDKWKESKEFRSQALKFVQTLSQAIKNLYHMDNLPPLLYAIGERHCIYAHRGFVPEHWDIFLDAMEVSLAAHIASLSGLDEKQKAEATATWRILSLYVIAHMKRGYMDGLRKMKKSRKYKC